MSARSRPSRYIIASLIVAATAACYPATRGKSTMESAGEWSGVASGAETGLDGRKLEVTSDAHTAAVDPTNGVALSKCVGEILSVAISGIRVDDSAGVVRLRFNEMRSRNYRNVPLFVIDGVPLASDYAISIFAVRVRRLDLVTNPLETAQYGPRGKGGVLLVTMRAEE